MKKEHILKIVRGREENKDFKERCLRVYVCPECGSELNVKSDGHPFLTAYECPVCEKSFTG